MLDTKVSKPSLFVRPSQPQIIVIPQSFLSTGGLKNIINLNQGEVKGPVVTRVVRPQVAIVKKPVEVVAKPSPLKRGPPTTSESSDDDSKSCDSLAKIRKRANLDHLTQEEKMMRRKLKNRVAAQNARDKKKLKMDEMEVSIHQYEERISNLMKMNQQLMRENKQLKLENDQLRSQQGLDLKVYVKEEVDQFPDSPLSELSSSQSPFTVDVDDSSSSLFDKTCFLSPVSFCSDDSNNGGEASPQCTSACDRLFEPAVPNHVLQQKGQSRFQTVKHVKAKLPDCHQAQNPDLLGRALPTPYSKQTSPLLKTFLETLTSQTQDHRVPTNKIKHWNYQYKT